MRQTPSPSAVLAKKKSFVPTNVTVDGLQRLIQHFCFEDKQEATEMMVCFNCFWRNFTLIEMRKMYHCTHHTHPWISPSLALKNGIKVWGAAWTWVQAFWHLTYVHDSSKFCFTFQKWSLFTEFSPTGNWYLWLQVSVLFSLRKIV